MNTATRFNPIFVSAANYDPADISTLNAGVLAPGAYGGPASTRTVNVVPILIVVAVLFLVWKVK